MDKQFWEEKYSNHQTGWDIGHISTPLKTYIDQLDNKGLTILIPGAGNAYEAEYLVRHGFKNVTIVDWVETAISNLQSRMPDFPKDNLLCKDFFELDGHFDLIIEQTFFCAIPKKLREDYVNKCYSLLNDGGKLAGLLFNNPMNDPDPPIGGTYEEYLALFSNHFQIKTLELCHNSIPPRAGNELFFIFKKK